MCQPLYLDTFLEFVLKIFSVNILQSFLDLQSGVRDVMNIPLPRPLSVTDVESAGDYALDNGTKSDLDQSHTEVLVYVHSTFVSGPNCVSCPNVN